MLEHKYKFRVVIILQKYRVWNSFVQVIFADLLTVGPMTQQW